MHFQTPAKLGTSAHVQIRTDDRVSFRIFTAQATPTTAAQFITTIATTLAELINSTETMSLLGVHPPNGKGGHSLSCDALERNISARLKLEIEYYGGDDIESLPHYNHIEKFP